MACERVPLADAAKTLGMSQQAVREYMKAGLIDIGIVVPNRTGNKRFQYLIFKDKLDKLIGKEVNGYEKETFSKNP